MNILKIAKKELLQNLRNVTVMLIMTVLPLAVIMLIGMALNGVFNSDEFAMDNLNLEYYIQGEKSDFSFGMESMISELLGEESRFVEVTDLEQSLKSLENKDITTVIFVDESEQIVKLYKNNEFYTQASIIENLLKNYTLRTNVVYEVTLYEPKLLNNTPRDYVDMRTINKNEMPSSMDYYGVVMCMLFLFYGITVPFTNTIKEKKCGTMDRILVSSATNKEMLIGKILGNTAVNGIQALIVMSATLFIYNVNWGSHLVLAVILVISLVVLVVSFGISLGFLINSEELGNAVIHTGIVIIAFFGGAYMPLVGTGILGEIGKYISPLWWSINGIMTMIYGNATEMLYQAIAINLSISSLLVLLTSLMINRKGGKYV
ncbi:MAG: ABC transporter permease [Clostridiales bacterium]|nr:ABC transporter permease [Clostridiales bacterium]